MGASLKRERFCARTSHRPRILLAAVPIPSPPLRCSFFRSTVYAARQCAELDGYYSRAEKACYYDVSTGGDDCRYLVNDMCYRHVDSSYTASTCSNIGGFFTTHNTRGEPGKFCYYTRFDCAGDRSANGQCYRFKSATDSRARCDANGGYYRHGYCYHDCPDTKFLVDGVCYDSRSADYTPDECRSVGGHYVGSYCHIERCSYSSVNNHCYRYRSASFSRGTCDNIGGYYAAETVPPYDRYCHYTTFGCRQHAVNGQCYSRAAKQPRAVCETVPHSYYDVTESTCYYYCTEMPQLSACVVGANSSFTTEMCDLIGGIYSNRTCYYVALYCPAYRSTGDLCYGERSANLSCDTCRNVGGDYDAGVCYYHRNNCSAYSVDDQCYSRRSYAYSAHSCNDIGGLYRDGYCYHEASRCRSSQHYRNCTCFSHRSPSKTAGTCANIGGYYDSKIRKCFYNSTACRYYSKNDQCYRYKDSNVARDICSNIGGSYVRDVDRFGRYTYACYFNDFICRNRINDQCYFRFSSSYNKGTCISIGGYYSNDNRTCYYNSFTCAFAIGGQCYDRYYLGWSKTECDEANGYYVDSYERCFISDYYCPHVAASYRKCSLYASAVYDCSSCRLLGGFVQSATCYYNRNCSLPLYLASDGQCYENRTAVSTASECSSMPGEAFYDDGFCHFSSGMCASGHYVRCRCYIHRSTVYSTESCSNYGGYYTNGRSSSSSS